MRSAEEEEWWTRGVHCEEYADARSEENGMMTRGRCREILRVWHGEQSGANDTGDDGVKDEGDDGALPLDALASL